MNFIQKLKKIVKKNNSLVCIGLDSDIKKIPQVFLKKKYPQFEFNKAIINQTHDLVCAYKPNTAFYEAEGESGIKQLKMTFTYLQKHHPRITTILDGKRADIGNTNQGYLKLVFDYLQADAITLNPYLGQEALKPFLERKDKGCILLCKTSNPGSGEFQNLKSQNKPLYQHVAFNVSQKWNKNNNCLLVVGATYPKELKTIRQITGNNFWLLVPGIGSQQGNVWKTVKAGKNSQGEGMIINSSRAIIFAGNPRQETIKLKEEINKYRN